MLKKGINKEGENIFEDLGYSISFFSSLNNQNSCGVVSKVRKFLEGRYINYNLKKPNMREDIDKTIQIEMNNKILPELNEQMIQCEEKMWRIKLPSDYYKFLLRTNGGVPQKREFNFNNHKYMIVSFLCILENAEHSEFGFYDIDVVLSQIEERLTDNEDLVGCELLPIAELFAGDYICLDFKENKDNPSVCVWDHEESGELEPVTYKVADTFSEFVAMLM